jgi:general secretion pathway protein D
MKKSVFWAACLVAALPLAATAQDSSKSSSGGVELADLVARVAKRAGKKIVLDPRVRAQVVLAGLEPGEIDYDQLRAILDVHQLAAIESAGIVIIVPDANARQLASPTYTDPGFKAADYEIVSLLVTPKKTCAMHLVPVLRPLMPQAAHLAAEVQTNTLIINDRAINARRIAAMVEQLDRRGTGAKDCVPPSMMQSQPASPPAKPAG